MKPTEPFRLHNPDPVLLIGFAGLAQISRHWIDRLIAGLVDLRLDQPIYLKAIFKRERFWIERNGRIPAIAAR